MGKDKSELTERNIFSLYSPFMDALGVWPLTPDSRLVRFKVMFITLEMIFGTITATTRITLACDDPKKNIEGFLMIFTGVLAVSKCNLYYQHRDSLAYVVNSALDDWRFIKNEQYKNMMVNRAKFCNSLTKFSYVMCMIPLSVYVANVFMSNDHNETYDGSSNSSAKKSTFKYLLPDGCAYDRFVDNLVLYCIVNLNQVIQVIIYVGTSLICDAYYVIITLHLCEQCEILKIAFGKLGITGGDEENRSYFSCLIMRHQHLMIIAETLDHIYNEIILIQMIGMLSFLIISAIGFLVHSNVGSYIDAAKDLGLLQFTLLQTLIYTFPADNLRNQGESLQDALYCCQWSDLPVSTKKNLTFILMRMNRPPSYTAYKVFYLTKESFLTMMKVTMSYMSVLRIMIC